MAEAGGAPRRVAVVGGGVAGLATALGLLDRGGEEGVDLDVTVFEAAPVPGGNLRTLREGEWQLEWGPNGFLDNEPATLQLVERLGLTRVLQRSSDATRRRFLLRDGRLHEIPTAPGAFLRSRLVSIPGKLRMAAEVLIPRRKDLDRAAEDPDTDETVAAFGTRRLGREFTEIMLDPMVKGIFGGEATRLSLAAAFPRMVELERDHGGLFRALVAISRERRARADAGPSGTLHSFVGGMQTLVEALAMELEADPRARLRTAAPVEALDRDGDGWYIRGPGLSEGPFHVVVDAAPAWAAAHHLEAVAPSVSRELAAIPFAPMAVIALGFPRDRMEHDLEGFGLLIPGRERREVLGVLWTSSIFPGRAPEGHVLLRVMAGGAGNPGIMERDDGALVATALGELGPLLGIRGEPVLARVIRHERAIAQYEPGHLARLARVDRELEHLHGLVLTGSSYRGISVNACVREAGEVARRVTGLLQGT